MNRKRIQRLMRKMGIQSVAPKPYTSKACPQNKIYPYLLRNLEIIMPDQVWCSDLTYIPVQKGFVYVTAVMDWYGRYVLSWELSVTMDREFCIAALEFPYDVIKHLKFLIPIMVLNMQALNLQRYQLIVAKCEV